MEQDQDTRPKLQPENVRIAPRKESGEESPVKSESQGNSEIEQGELPNQV